MTKEQLEKSLFRASGPKTKIFIMTPNGYHIPAYVEYSHSGKCFVMVLESDIPVSWETAATAP